MSNPPSKKRRLSSPSTPDPKRPAPPTPPAQTPPSKAKGNYQSPFDEEWFPALDPSPLSLSSLFRAVSQYARDSSRSRSGTLRNKRKITTSIHTRWGRYQTFSEIRSSPYYTMIDLGCKQAGKEGVKTVVHAVHPVPMRYLRDLCQKELRYMEVWLLSEGYEGELGERVEETLDRIDLHPQNTCLPCHGRPDHRERYRGRDLRFLGPWIQSAVSSSRKTMTEFEGDSGRRGGGVRLTKREKVWSAKKTERNRTFVRPSPNATYYHLPSGLSGVRLVASTWSYVPENGPWRRSYSSTSPSPGYQHIRESRSGEGHGRAYKAGQRISSLSAPMPVVAFELSSQATNTESNCCFQHFGDYSAAEGCEMNLAAGEVASQVCSHSRNGKGVKRHTSDLHLDASWTSREFPQPLDAGPSSRTPVCIAAPDPDYQTAGKTLQKATLSKQANIG
ncbi:hypothetical protein BDV95DRAFT_595010 [Massariosphaeria phaeospora]|uniref:Uncharacterized protein n=1 Tax=Massariosphaeria phaeospora TaxID=100035 RepID=A0A7C8I562_9PLEO|nr:hypothetical protein BDV95DRAFT_595010 [Massariosphaeria phaeospora]